MGIEHKESLQECQISPEGMPLSWVREYGIDPGFPALPTATRTPTGFQLSWNGSMEPGRPTGFPGHGGSPYERNFREQPGAPAPKSRSFAPFAAASPCRARLRDGCKPAQISRPAWLRPPIRSVLAPPRHPAPGGTNRRSYLVPRRGTTSFISPRPLRPASTIRRT
jgi:hypothetical protein